MIESSVSCDKPLATTSLASPKIHPSHLERSAVLYVRQSTGHQLREHQESTARQYQLASRLRLLGWRQDQIIIIDEDLGISGSGHVKRDGFRRLLKLVTDQQVGIVLGLEMSRLARNSKDWSDLFEVCAIFDVLIADEDGVFLPNDPNDRLVLGLKGIISEMELHTMKVRLERGRLNKAQRGELIHHLPVGFVKGSSGLPQFDPDRAIWQVHGPSGRCMALCEAADTLSFYKRFIGHDLHAKKLIHQTTQGRWGLLILSQDASLGEIFDSLS